MKRVLDQTPTWVVVPASVLGASLLLALSQWLLETDSPSHRVANPRSGRQSADRMADSRTPPVAKHEWEAASGDPSPHLLSRMDGDSVESAEASGVFSIGERADSPQCLASSDAVSVLASADRRGSQVNTGWLPADLAGMASARPIPLLPLGSEIPQARVAQPSPRYGSNSSGWDEIPLVAPIEERHEVVGASSLGLIVSLFQSPALERNPPRSGAGVLRRAPRAAVVAGEFQAFPQIPKPLPPVEAEPVLVSLPPVEPRLIVDPGPGIAMIGGLFKPIAAESGAGVDVDRCDEVPTSLPPVTESEDSGDLEALAVGEAGVDVDRSDEVPTSLPPVTESEDSGDLEALAVGEAGVDVDRSDEVPQSLPPIEESVDEEELEVVEATEVDGDSFEPREYERSWELELIAGEADKHTRRGFELAGKKAYFSARLEFTRALRITAQGLDTERKTSRHSEALAAGLRALVEAEDYLPKNGHLEADLDLAVIAWAHRTPVLRECDASELTPLGAIQRYHTFAQEQMAVAAGKEMAGSMALAGLGKLHMVMGDQQRGDGIASASPKAMALLQAALIASPANHMASNELGILLARNGRQEEARAAFEYSVGAHPTAEGWRNLALTCEALGEMDEAYRAAQETLALRDKSKGKAPASSRGSIRWVPPSVLASTGGNLRTASTTTNRAR